MKKAILKAEYFLKSSKQLKTSEVDQENKIKI